MNSIFFYDGDCGFCQQSVQFVLKHERKHSLSFASLQGEVAAKLLPQDLTQNLDSVVVYQNGKVLTESDAILLIVRKLKFPFIILLIFKLVPVSIRNYFYQLVARNRYKFTGLSKMCKIPDEIHRKRFLN
ncbi:thiol-disulfide oxidoreductase DCC family protein [uncultured Rummeliibacillus sp.]|uniref:thiol-disulfide oxidoreductase DCC family protein n=1 Tax=uncultured Rummeliibacillus sp. TaxID=762292 RepID=UPI0026149844|nr:DCC1-like thiol-disulfide oxidoreductase family protein [uncultured Rummeliibacillus sp.]